MNMQEFKKQFEAKIKTIKTTGNKYHLVMSFSHGKTKR